MSVSPSLTKFVVCGQSWARFKLAASGGDEVVGEETLGVLASGDMAPMASTVTARAGANGMRTFNGN